MHRPFGKFGNEGEGYQIQKPFDEPPGAKLRFSVFTRLVLHHLFGDAAKAGPFGNDRNITVHLTINLDGFYHVAVVGF